MRYAKYAPVMLRVALYCAPYATLLLMCISWHTELLRAIKRHPIRFVRLVFVYVASFSLVLYGFTLERATLAETV